MDRSGQPIYAQWDLPDRHGHATPVPDDTGDDFDRLSNAQQQRGHR